MTRTRRRHATDHGSDRTAMEEPVYWEHIAEQLESFASAQERNGRKRRMVDSLSRSDARHAAEGLRTAVRSGPAALKKKRRLQQVVRRLQQFAAAPSEVLWRKNAVDGLTRRAAEEAEVALENALSGIPPTKPHPAVTIEFPDEGPLGTMLRITVTGRRHRVDTPPELVAATYVKALRMVTGEVPSLTELRSEVGDLFDVTPETVRDWEMRYGDKADPTGGASLIIGSLEEVMPGYHQSLTQAACQYLSIREKKRSRNGSIDRSFNWHRLTSTQIKRARADLAERVRIRKARRRIQIRFRFKRRQRRRQVRSRHPL